jgi:hypothetical protein
MAAGALKIYTANAEDINITDLLSATVKLALVGSGYTPNSFDNGHDEWSDVSANEIANGNGYTTGGYTLLSDAVINDSGGDYVIGYDSADPTWTASGGDIPTWKYGVLYVSGSLWAKTSPLIGYFEGESGSTVAATPNGVTLTITVAATGWFTITMA